MKYFSYCLTFLLFLSFLSCNVNSTRITCEDENRSDYEESVSHFEKKVEANDEDEKSIYALGMSQYKLADYENAIISFTKLIEMNSEYPARYLNRGLCKFFQEDYSGACEDFKSSVEIGVDHKVMNDEKLSKYVQDNCDS